MSAETFHDLQQASAPYGVIHQKTWLGCSIILDTFKCLLQRASRARGLSIDSLCGLAPLGLESQGLGADFQKQFFDHYLFFLLCLKRERFEVISVNIRFFFHHIIRCFLYYFNFWGLKCTIPLWKAVVWSFCLLFMLPHHLERHLVTEQACTVGRVSK